MSNQGFEVFVRDDRIIQTNLHSFARRYVENWMAYVKSHDGKLKPPVRMLYDFREAGLPSRYVLEIIGPFMKTLIIPEDTRSAYIFPSAQARFSMSFMRRLPPEAGAVRVFNDEESAVEWLLAEKED